MLYFIVLCLLNNDLTPKINLKNSKGTIIIIVRVIHSPHTRRLLVILQYTSTFACVYICRLKPIVMTIAHDVLLVITDVEWRVYDFSTIDSSHRVYKRREKIRFVNVRIVRRFYSTVSYSSIETRYTVMWRVFVVQHYVTSYRLTTIIACTYILLYTCLSAVRADEKNPLHCEIFTLCERSENSCCSILRIFFFFFPMATRVYDCHGTLSIFPAETLTNRS